MNRLCEADNKKGNKKQKQTPREVKMLTSGAEPSDEAGLEAMRRSLATMMEAVTFAEKALAIEKEEHATTRRECTRLRKENNHLLAAKADGMMDVAMAASVQTLHDEGEQQRRSNAECSLLSNELQQLEAAFSAGAPLASIQQPSRGVPPTSCDLMSQALPNLASRVAADVLRGQGRVGQR